MPYDNVPDDKQDEMDRCVQKVMADGKDKQAAIAICYTSIVEGKNVSFAGVGAYMPESPDVAYFGGEVKALEGGNVGGYLVRYTDPTQPDLTGDFFDAKTDIKSPAELPVLYQHGQDVKMGRRVLGKATTRTDDVGVWVDAQLDLRDKYEKAIYELAKQGKLGWSSGAIGHLVEREPVGKAQRIKSWWIGEASLTPNPAEPRNVAMPIKSLATPAAALDAGEVNQAQPKENIMSDEIKAAVDAALAEREAAAKAEQARQEEIKKAKDEGYQAALAEIKSGGPAVKKITERGFSEEKDAVPAFKHWLKTGQVNGGLIAPDATFGNIPDAKAAWNVTTGASGGYLVPDPLYNQIVAKRNLASWVRQAPVQMFTTVADHLLVPVESTSHTAFVLTAEAAAYNEDEGTIAQKDLVLYKYTKMLKASEEFLGYEQTNWESWLSQALARAEAVTENTIFTTGTGTGQPQGVLTGATSSSITLGAVDTITAAEMAALVGKLGAGYNVPSECGFLMANATKWYLRGIVNSGPYAFNSPATAPIGPFGFAEYVSDDMAPYTTESDKPVLFGNMNYYGVVEKPGMVVQRNPYLYMANGQIGIFASFFRGGGVLQAEAFYYLTSHS